MHFRQHPLPSIRSALPTHLNWPLMRVRRQWRPRLSTRGSAELDALGRAELCVRGSRGRWRAGRAVRGGTEVCIITAVGAVITRTLKLWTANTGNVMSNVVLWRSNRMSDRPLTRAKFKPLKGRAETVHDGARKKEQKRAAKQ